MNNIKESLLAYCVHFINIVENEPVFVSEDESFVGIELPYNLDVKISYKDKDEEKSLTFNFIGKIDGIHINDKGIIVHENKTSARLDDSWLTQWQTSHQITGYCLASSTIMNQVITQARVLGMQIPVPKSSGYAFRSERVDREVYNFDNWAKWAIHQVNMINNYKDDPFNAPMSTDNCCKYFTTCPLMSICVLDINDKREALSNMITDMWSPLDE